MSPAIHRLKEALFDLQPIESTSQCGYGTPAQIQTQQSGSLASVE